MTLQELCPLFQQESLHSLAKTSLGIEIPNNKREGVLFGDLINDENFLEENRTLRLALGKSISGENIYTDLEKMPHLLIAGTTGSGKSVKYKLYDYEFINKI